MRRLRPAVAEYYRILSDDREQVELHYRSELDERPFDELLLAARQRDLANEFTTAGIHRDDLVLQDRRLSAPQNTARRGSRSRFLIALKLAQYAIVADLRASGRCCCSTTCSTSSTPAGSGS